MNKTVQKQWFMDYVTMNSFIFFSLSSLSIFNFKNINFHFQGFFRKKHLTSIQLRNSNTLHLEILYGMIKCPCQIKLDWWFLFFSENHLITLPIISHDQELWNDIQKTALFLSLCVCVLKKGTKKVLLSMMKKKDQSLNRAPTISAFEAWL